MNTEATSEANAESLAIPPEFADWMRPVLVGASDEQLRKRWSAVHPHVSKSTSQTIDSLIQLVFGILQPDAEELKWFVESFNKADPAFTVSANAEELKYLAASVLGSICRTGPQRIETALAILTTSCAGQRLQSVRINLRDVAQASLISAANDDRRRQLDALRSLPKMDKDIFGQLGARLQQNPNGHAVEVLNGLAEKLGNYQAQVGSVFSSNMKLLRDTFNAQDEEVLMLGWLVAGWCDTLNCPREDVDASAAPILVALDLRRLTWKPPGPPSVKALISRMGVGATPALPIEKAVNAVPLETLTKHVDMVIKYRYALPVHAAMSKRRETGDTESWQAGWAASLRLKRDSTSEPRELALQTYYERLLIALRSE